MQTAAIFGNKERNHPCRKHLLPRGRRGRTPGERPRRPGQSPRPRPHPPCLRQAGGVPRSERGPRTCLGRRPLALPGQSAATHLDRIRLGGGQRGGQHGQEGLLRNLHLLRQALSEQRSIWRFLVSLRLQRRRRPREAGSKGAREKMCEMENISRKDFFDLTRVKVSPWLEMYRTTSTVLDLSPWETLMRHTFAAG